jgi:four helix bundle suffix protein
MLLIDYKDFLRTNKLTCRDKAHPYYSQIPQKHKTPNASYETYQKGIESPDPEVSANVMISLINVTSYQLAPKIKTLEKEFLEEGGLRERMSQARIEV